MQMLGKRAVAAGWEWQAGVLLVRRNSLTQLRVACINGDYADLIAPSGHWAAAPIGNDLPDFNDAATRGVLLEQVRERWKYAAIFTRPVLMNNMEVWWNVETFDSLISTANSEVEALIAALEAAPKEKGL